MPSTLNLTEISEPNYTLKLPDGTEKQYKLWTLMADLQAVHRDHGSDDLYALWDGIRKTFGLPTADEYAAAPDPKPFTLSPAQAIATAAHVFDTISEASEGKKR